MKCPLLFIANCALPSMKDTVEWECLQEECAWWDKDQNCCGWIAGNKALFALVDVLTDIRDKMPHEEQFRR